MILNSFNSFYNNSLDFKILNYTEKLEVQHSTTLLNENTGIGGP